jgi:hypothetical protein
MAMTAVFVASEKHADEDLIDYNLYPELSIVAV